MYEKELKDLEYISQAVGNPVEYTQGGGGNTSAKLSDELMAIKASGFKLKQINPREGYVVVNHQAIIGFFEKAALHPGRDYETECNEFVKGSVVETEGLKKARPSVEAGFHSFLKKYVIHTHSVYANMVCCIQNGSETVGRIFRESDIITAWIPYTNPGFSLSLKIAEAVERISEQSGRFPEAIFMENHGLIVTDDDAAKCVELHEQVNKLIMAYLGIKEAFPAIELFKIDDNTFVSKTEYLTDYFKRNKINVDFFDELVLYPDQLVYLNGSISVDGMNGKLNINSRTGEIIYKAGFSEAETIEETLLAYIYVVNGIKNSGLSIKTMPAEGIGFIKNWESEAYRKSLVRQSG